MTVPGFWPFVLLGLGAFRLVRLVGWDDITITPRKWLTGLGDDEHAQWAHVIDTARQHRLDPWDMTLGVWWDQFAQTPNKEVPPLVARFGLHDTSRHKSGDEPYLIRFVPPVGPARYYLSKMLRCPWCFGFWTALAVWAVYQAWPHGTLIVMSLFAVSAIPGLVAKNLDK